MNFFVRHRTALASHVERQFWQVFRKSRTTRLHLQTLMEAGDLSTAPRIHLAGPNVYLLAPRGLATWAENAGHTAIGDVPLRRRRPNGSHLLHELLITELAVSLSEAARDRSDLTICWEERFELAARPAFQDLLPDYAFHFRMATGEQLVCLAEISAGEDSPRRLAIKLDKYVRWTASTAGQQFLVQAYEGQGARNPQPVFRILFVVHNRRGADNARLRELLRQVVTRDPVFQNRIWATTVEDLAKANGLLAPVWIRARDLSVSPERDRAKLTLSALPRHSLFPKTAS